MRNALIRAAIVLVCLGALALTACENTTAADEDNPLASTDITIHVQDEQGPVEGAGVVWFVGDSSSGPWLYESSGTTDDDGDCTITTDWATHYANGRYYKCSASKNNDTGEKIDPFTASAPARIVITVE
ncbi:MAG: hypothetical protein GF399_09410 [Candidatus Coatesbacteria bacterium]|nr:hypothetical protein [Candidatus Coatesbacteria bacterium]